MVEASGPTMTAEDYDGDKEKYERRGGGEQVAHFNLGVTVHATGVGVGARGFLRRDEKAVVS